MKRAIWIGIHAALTTTLVVAAMLPNSGLYASEVSTVSLRYETQALDLETGTILDCHQPCGGPAGDIRLAYNASRTPNAVVMPVEVGSLELAYVDDVAFDGMTSDAILDLAFSTAPVDMPFSANATLVIRTRSGSYYKLGNAVESEELVLFNISKLM